jgi:hypothetical protein
MKSPMMALTRHVMDSVLPYVPTRQWVLSLPHALRYRLAYDQTLATAVHGALVEALRSHLCGHAVESGRGEPRPGCACARDAIA